MEKIFSRRLTKEVKVGNVGIGGSNPVRIQSMTNTDTMNTDKTVQQVLRLAEVGCELVRITASDTKSANNLYNIKNELYKHNCNIPLIADIHFNPKAAEIAAKIVEKVRINPGNYTDRNTGKFDYTDIEYADELKRTADRLFPLIEICKKHNTAMRIGTNHGSLSQRIIGRYGNTPIAMAHSAMEFVKICNGFNYNQIVLSMKSSNVLVMSLSTRLLVEMLDKENLNFPVHLGVTEAGEGEDGRIKSATGIGSLLCLGIGDTIRVSLTEEPEDEIPVAKAILQATGCRTYKADIISCPSCGRTKYDIATAVKKVKERCSHLIGIKIAVMGCIVNGPGEMIDADYGYIGSIEGKVHLYKKGKLTFPNVDEKKAIDVLLQMIEEDKASSLQSASHCSMY
ncbi:MAG: (E)-4-hydroxy-3-methylbut-2-enyl-diphosphate synthase [Bacteroidales bacterium]|jgi:(E)-4-hydroxy-3-methylbut-2-enyl-diphosphate synthase|nr:(E)-4-hydroxy-3-methylbut-2-enyl-diphosphate synthase [Bacteroidales bacterium]